MPLRLKDIEESGAPISFQRKGTAEVRIGPCSATTLKSNKIPLDGRHYVCAGIVIFKNGIELNANFEIATHTFDFLERDSVKVYIESERTWYYIGEKELLEILNVKTEDIIPYKWLPDIPLDYHEKGPYPMEWPVKDS
ncbi:MAG: hypothetical protein M0D53_08885 [Flavobacterium sp. JAD_PAG50586_2]|nr:MAG: hypothetical protein M0D53_08885 [Flavobacterium sp. JAD_PAG50586_2]